MGLQLHTRNITSADGVFSLDGTEGVLMISYQMSATTGDACTLTGNLAFRAASDASAQPSAPISIGPGQGNTFTSDANQKGLVLSLSVSQGTLKLIIGR